MSTIPLPLELFPRRQEDLIWLAAESDGAMGRKSNQGAIQARLEGGGGSYSTDILGESYDEWLRRCEEATKKSGFRAATRAKYILRAYKLCTFDHQNVLAAAYWTTLQRGLEAWDRLGNLVVLSQIAYKKHRMSRSKLSFGEWVTVLSARKVGVLDRSGFRSKPKATLTEQKIVLAIERECQEMLKGALVEYSNCFRRISCLRN